VSQSASSHPIDDLLRARLRITRPARLRLFALRNALLGIDGISRGLTGQAFFAVREAEALLRDIGTLQGPPLIAALLARNGGTHITPHGLTHIPSTGPIIIGATHPVGIFDFISHAAVLLDHRPDLKVVANREAERFLGPERIIPVDLDSSDRVRAPRVTRTGMQDHLENGGALLVFGSGRVPHQHGGRLVEPAWRTGITRISGLTDTPVVPASADLRNSPYYYRIRSLAYRLSGKNDYAARAVASLRYVAELLDKLGGSYHVHYGPPLAAGSSPAVLKSAAESLVPGLYSQS
jgi:hypothetical protein